MPVKQASNGMKGFDCNAPLTDATAKAFFADGNRFAGRYVPHDLPPHSYDVTAGERTIIQRAGLAFLPVQHVPPEHWVPTPSKGTIFGGVAVQCIEKVGVIKGVNVVLDLEGVASGIPFVDVIAYCNNWWNVVNEAEYLPMLYVGDSPGLTGAQLYQKLKFKWYWGAYNVNSDQHPLPRDFCMKQHLQKTLVGVQYDPDTIQADTLGGLPVFDAPEGWAA